jgi:hypothetical protein
METEREYAAREKRMFRAQIADTEKQPLRDRQEARSEFREVMAQHPDRVAERIAWILEGNYGFGAYTEAREVVVNKRMNRAAWFVSMVGALDHSCPPEFTMGAWKTLTAAQKKNLDVAVMAVIEEYAKQLAPARKPAAKRKASRNGAKRGKMMSKAEVNRSFRENVLPHLRHTDRVSVRTAWLDYTDELNRDGRISDHARNNWVNPYR